MNTLVACSANGVRNKDIPAGRRDYGGYSVQPMVIKTFQLGDETTEATTTCAISLSHYNHHQPCF